MQKKLYRLIISLLLIFSVLSTYAFAMQGGTGNPVYSNSVEIADGLTYKNIISYNSSGSRVESYVLETERYGDVYPIVMACDTIYGGMTESEVISYAASQGYNVLGAVNSDFFFASYRIPLGTVVEDGEYKSSPEDYNVLYFTERGAAISRSPKISIELQNNGGGGGGSGAVQKTTLSHLNKLRQETGGLYLFSSAFSTVSTRTSTDGWAVRFKILSGSLKTSCSMELEVTETYTGSSATYIGDGFLVLSAAAASGLESEFEKYSVGDKVTLCVTCSDPDLINAEWASGCGDVLVSNGQVTGDSWDSALYGLNPRSALGIKADGSIICYVVDGRSETYSAGAKMSETAADLIALGCVDAVNLDGGGSSAMAVRIPGNSECTIVNRPSDGALRRCSTYILLVTDRKTGNGAERLHLKQDGMYVYSGSTVELGFAASDSAYKSAPVPSDITAEASTGIIDGYTYTAGYENGRDSIELYSPSRRIYGKGNIYVVSSFDELKVTDTTTGQKPVLTNLSKSSKINLSTSAFLYKRNVSIDLDEIKYSLTGKVGTVSKDGVFDASSGIPGEKGILTVSAGGKSADFPVSLSAAFLDIENHWAKQYIEKLAESGIVSGTSSTTFTPNANIKRGDFVLMLWRAAGKPEPSSQAPFSDVSPDSYYAKAIAWAAGKDIAKGSGKGMFMPEKPLTREDAFTLVYRALGVYGYNVNNADKSLLNAFSDSPNVSSYAEIPTATLISLNIINGSNGKLNPRESITRAEMAKILHQVLYS